MTTEYSVEDLISMGTGLMTQKKETSTSIEGYDGYEDEIYAAVSRSEETLKFLDTFDMLQTKLSSEKLRMLKKINANYNGKTIGNVNAANSIESYVNGQIYSLEEAAEKPETKPAEKVEKPDTTKGEKVKSFFKKIITTIKEFFKNIGKFFVMIWKKIKGLFTKVDPNNVELKTADEIAAAFDPHVSKDEKTGKLSEINSSKVNKGTHTVEASASDYLVDFKSVDMKKISDILEDIKTTAKSVNKFKTNEAPTGDKKDDNYYALKNRGAQTDANYVKEYITISEKDDATILANIYKVKKLTPEEFVKRSNNGNGVRQIVEFINKFIALENNFGNAVSLLNKACDQVENYVSSAQNVNVENTKSYLTLIRKSGSAANKLAKVGMKMAQCAYKCLKPKSKEPKNA